MSDDIVVIAPKDVAESKALSKDLANSALMPQALRKKPEDVFAIVLAGAELGLAPMQAVRGLHIINGKVGLSADLMGALVKRSPACEYLQLVESTGQVATYRTKRRGDPEPTTISFTLAQAKAAGITGNPQWGKYPDAMLRARALAAICRAVYPDLCLGLYDSDSGEIEPEPRDATPQQAHIAAVKESLKSQVVDAEYTAVSARDALAERITAAKTAEELLALVPDIKSLTVEERKSLQQIFTTRKQELAQ
jgi:hypothetical protein